MYPKTPTERQIYERLTEEQRRDFYYEGSSAIWGLLTENEKKELQREWEEEQAAWEEERRRQDWAYFAGY